MYSLSIYTYIIHTNSMAAMNFWYSNKLLPLTEKNHQKSGNYPILIKFPVFIYQSQKKTFFSLNLNRCAYRTIPLIMKHFTNKTYLLNVS